MKKYNIIPKNLEECFIELKKILPEGALEKFKNTKEDEAVVNAHLGLGIWIRNRIQAFFTNFYQILQSPKMPTISSFFLSSTFYLVLPKSTIHVKS